MLLKYIGEDGSMGLRKGEYYDCEISSYEDYIWVRWTHKTVTMSCPYGSIRSFSASWC